MFAELLGISPALILVKAFTSPSFVLCTYPNSGEVDMDCWRFVQKPSTTSYFRKAFHRMSSAWSDSIKHTLIPVKKLRRSFPKKIGHFCQSSNHHPCRRTMVRTDRQFEDRAIYLKCQRNCRTNSFVGRCIVIKCHKPLSNGKLTFQLLAKERTQDNSN